MPTQLQLECQQILEFFKLATKKQQLQALSLIDRYQGAQLAILHKKQQTNDERKSFFKAISTVATTYSLSTVLGIAYELANLSSTNTARASQTAINVALIPFLLAAMSGLGHYVLRSITAQSRSEDLPIGVRSITPLLNCTTELVAHQKNKSKQDTVNHENLLSGLNFFVKNHESYAYVHLKAYSVKTTLADDLSSMFNSKQLDEVLPTSHRVISTQLDAELLQEAQAKMHAVERTLTPLRQSSSTNSNGANSASPIHSSQVEHQKSPPEVSSTSPYDSDRFQSP